MPLVKRGSLSSCPIPKSPCSLSALPTGGAGAEASKRDCSTCRTFHGPMALVEQIPQRWWHHLCPAKVWVNSADWTCDPDIIKHETHWNPKNATRNRIIWWCSYKICHVFGPRQRPPLPSRLLQGLVHLPLEPIEKAPRRGSRGLLSLGSNSVTLAGEKRLRLL